MANNGKRPYKSRQFELYVVWKSLPLIYRGQEENTLKKLGIEDEQVIGLLHLKTQGEFARKYKIDAGTLSDWNKKIKEGDLTAPYRNSSLREMVHNVNAAFAVSVYRNLTPSGVRLLNELGGDKLEMSKRGYVRREEAMEMFEKYVEERGPILILKDGTPEELEKLHRKNKQITEEALNILYPEEDTRTDLQKRIDNLEKGRYIN